VEEKVYSQRSGKSGKRYPKEFGGPVGGPEEDGRASLAGADKELRRCQNDGRKLYSRNHVRVSVVCAAVVRFCCRKIDRRVRIEIS
jgi:hypothetical protein